MFFLGLAGPFMPYLLMTGILIVFALEVSVKKMCPPAKDPAGHSVSLLSGETGTMILADYCYFYSQVDESPQKDSNENGFLLHPYFPPPGMENETKISSINDFLNATDHHNCYFGLSPPCMFI